MNQLVEKQVLNIIWNILSKFIKKIENKSQIQ